MKRIMFLCHGNICRSPMAQMILAELAARRGLSGEITVDSAAVSREEIGNGIYPPARDELREHGIPILPHRARIVTAQDYADWDLFLCMDQSNLRLLRRIFPADSEQKVHLLMEYTDRPGDVSDPWYTDRFDIAYKDILSGCEGLLDTLF